MVRAFWTVALALNLAFWVLALTGCDMFGRRGDLPEPPPKGWEALGLRPGSTVKTFSDPTALDRYCETEIGRPASLYDPHARYGGECWVPRTHTLVMMDDKTARDPEMQAARRVHGNTHSWGLTHSGGDRDWIYPDRRPAQAITPAQVQMMLAMARAEQQRANVFAQQRPDVQPASGNIFGGK